MPITQADYHLEMAMALAAQRFEWAGCEDIAADSLHDLEQRWRAHLHVAAEIPVSEAEREAASRPEEVCALLARQALGGGCAADREAAWHRACDYLALGEAHGEGASWFLSLFPHPTASEPLGALFRNQPALRSQLFHIWSVQSAPVPLERVREVLDEADSPAATRAAAVEYASGRAEATPDLFQPLLRDREQKVRAAALTAVLIRGDASGTGALAELLTREADERLYRLAALTGDPILEPALQVAAARTPETGLTNLALFGRREVVPVLLAAIENPRTAEIGAKAWELLTGRRLPRVPRLTLVGQSRKSEGVAAPEERALRVPDAAAASAWWEREKNRWSSGVRYFRGRPVDVGHVALVASRAAGLLGRSMHTLLELTIKQPLGVSAESWVANRRACYLSRCEGAGSPQGARRA